VGARGSVAFAGVGPGRQGELLQGEAGVVGTQQVGDQRLGGVGPEAGIVADHEVDRGYLAHSLPPASASRIRSISRTTRTVPATSWTRTIRQPWLTP